MMGNHWGYNTNAHNNPKPGQDRIPHTQFKIVGRDIVCQGGRFQPVWMVGKGKVVGDGYPTLKEAVEAKNRIAPLLKGKPELFCLGRTVLSSATELEVTETVSALRKLDLYKLPYPKVSIQIPNGSLVYQAVSSEAFPLLDDGPKWSMVLTGLTVDRPGVFLHYEGNVPFAVVENDKWSDILRDILITFLATKNITAARIPATDRQEREIALPAKIEYVTELRLPTTYTPSAGVILNRALPRPHLRRGHIRRQPCGPGLAYETEIWVQPCIVNGNEDFVSPRKRYNVSTEQH